MTKTNKRKKTIRYMVILIALSAICWDLAILKNVAVEGTYRYIKDFDAVTGYNFHAPVTGIYQFNVMLRLLALDTASDWVQIYLNTDNRAYASHLDPDGLDQDPTSWTFHINVLADMTAGDTAAVHFGYSSGAQQVDSPGTEIYSHFSGHLVGQTS